MDPWPGAGWRVHHVTHHAGVASLPDQVGIGVVREQHDRGEVQVGDGGAACKPGMLGVVVSIMVAHGRTSVAIATDWAVSWAGPMMMNPASVRTWVVTWAPVRGSPWG
jgi:hypothetical protein